MLTAKDVMTKEVVTIGGNATVAEAARVMKSHMVRALIVDRRSLQDAYGIVTQRDIAYKVIARGLDARNVKVHEIQSKPLLVINPDLAVEYIARMMANFGLSRAPVIFEHKLQGIVTVSDLVNKVIL